MPTTKASRAIGDVSRSIRADERRRIARELHDSTSQVLVVLQLQLNELRRCHYPGAEPLIEQCEAAIREVRDQIRSLDTEGVTRIAVP